MSYIDQITVDSTTYDIQDSNAQRKTIVGSGAPTTSTVGTLGVHYFDTSATEAPYEYICVDISEGSYTWEPVGSGTEMVVLSYGSSTWAQFEAAYNKNAIVYCKASSNSNPATGSQGRMAFMAFVNFSGTTMTSVEFQYYRSVSSHTDSQQGDQVFIYKLDKSAGWTVTVREAYTKIVAGNGLGSSYSNGVLTLTGNVQTVDGKTGAVSVIPSGGTTGQVLAKTSATNYDVGWTDTHSVPSGGTQGQVLTKSSATDYDVAWADASGGDSGPLIVTISSSSYQDGSRYSIDSTFNDIAAAIQSGREVILKAGAGSEYYYHLEYSYSSSGTISVIRFCRENLSSSDVFTQYGFTLVPSDQTHATFSHLDMRIKTLTTESFTFVVESDGDGGYSVSDSTLNDVMQLYDYDSTAYTGSLAIFTGEVADNDGNYYKNFDIYPLVGVNWTFEYESEWWSDWLIRGHLSFSKIVVDNGTNYNRTITVSWWQFMSVDTAEVTVTDTAL